MHVALYSPAWGRRTYPNGIVTYVHWMREALRACGHRVSIVTGGMDAPEQDVHLVVPTTGYKVRSWFRSKTVAPALPAAAWGEAIANTVRSVHQRQAIDVLEMEESFGWFDDVARRLPVPVVVKLHGPAFLSLVEDELATPMAAAKIAAEGRALRRARVVTSPAQATLDATVVRYGLSTPIARHIVNPLALPPSVPAWRLADCDRRMLLFVGRFDARKGGDLVLQAFGQLSRSNPDLTLCFVGPDAGLTTEGGPKEHFEQARARLLEGSAAARVTFKGRLPPDEVCALRAASFATMVTSRWENQSYTLLEAMLQGCPVVSSDVGGHAEIIEHGVSGLLCEPGNAADLAAKLQQLLDDPERAAVLGSNAREHVRKTHLPAHVAARTLEIYDAARAAAAVARTAGRSAA